MNPPLRRGEMVTVREAGREGLPAMVTLVSTNGRSVLVMFDGVLGDSIGAAALLEDEGGPDLETTGRFRTLSGVPVIIER